MRSGYYIDHWGDIALRYEDKWEVMNGLWSLDPELYHDFDIWLVNGLVLGDGLAESGSWKYLGPL
jgi:hypothetical protein